jgi:hypothetical protein
MPEIYFPTVRLRPRKDKANNKVESITIIDGSGTAADSGSAEGNTEPLPVPSEAPKCARHTP